MRAEDEPRFRSLRPLGRGGTAEVRLVRILDRGTNAALKSPLASSDEPALDFAHLARREYDLIGGLRFPGLVRLLEPPHDNPAYLLLEYCAGPTLDRLGRTQSAAHVLALLSAIAVNLEFLNAHQLIHGDLKPQNVFLPELWEETWQGGLFLVKLSDFSLGRAYSETESARAGLGTVGYMAPETITERKTSHQSDLFALGVIAYQLFTGRHPFLSDEPDPLRVNSRVLEETPPPLSQVRPDLEAGISELVERLMAKSESGRPACALDVCAELERLGCTYPYRKVLRPSWFFSQHYAVKDILGRWISASAADHDRLMMISGGDGSKLRLCLSANFRNGNLRYSDGRFAFEHLPLWPSRIRRQTLRTLGAQRCSLRRATAVAAVVGTPEAAAAILPDYCASLERVDPAAAILLRPLLRPATVRRLSTRLAVSAEQGGHLETAAQLFVQAGDLVGAERCAYEGAFAYRRSHENLRALALLRHVIRFAELTDRLWDVRQLLMLAGDVHKENGDAEKALVYYRRIIFLYATCPGDKLLAETYKDLGDLYKMKQDFPAGLEALRRALAIYQELGDELEISHTHNNMGNIYWIAGDMKSALSRYRLALRIQRRLDARSDIASTLSNLGSIYAIGGRLRRAITIMDRSLHMKRELAHQGEIARSLNNLGLAYYLNGQFDKAQARLQESLEINQRLGSKKEVLFNLDNLVAIMVTAGNFDEAAATIDSGLRLSAELSDAYHTGVFELSLGQITLRRGDFEGASRHFASVAEVVSRVDDFSLEAMLMVQQADLQYRLGRRPEALAAALAALAYAAERKAVSSQVSALLLITRLSGSSEYRVMGERLIHESHLQRDLRLLQFCVLEQQLQAERVPAADLLQHCRSVLDETGNDLELPWMCNLLAAAQIQVGRFDDARTVLKVGQSLAAATGLSWELLAGHTLLGRLDAAQGLHECCFMSYQKALALAKKVATTISRPEERQAFQQQREIQFLVNEIRNFGARMGQTKRAGSGPALCKT